jgi:CheY-like chemotaxis protein
LEATKLIVARRKEQPEAVHPGIVFLTAHALDDYRERAIEAGGDGFISKPFKVAAIKEFLERCKMLGQQHSIGDGIQQQ